VSLISDALNEAQREANRRRKESQPALLGENPISPPAVVVARPSRRWPIQQMVYTALGIAVVSALATGVLVYRGAKSESRLAARSDSTAGPAITKAQNTAQNTAGARDTSVNNVGMGSHVAPPPSTQPATRSRQAATNTVRPSAVASRPRATATPTQVPVRHIPVRPPAARARSNNSPTSTGTAPGQPAASAPPSTPVGAASPDTPAPQPRVSSQDVCVIVDPTVLRSGDSLFIRAYAEQTRGNLDAAADLYERALTKPPVSPELYNDYGALLATRGKHAAAITMYNLGIAANDKDARLWANLADSYRAMGRRADAMGAYFEATKLDPMNIGVRLRLAAEYASLGDTASARRGFDEAVHSAPNDAEAHYRYGAFLQTQHDVGGAIRELQTFVDLAPGKYPTDVIERTKAYIANLRRTAR
jgi:tetratricopeptide (TPR) repeat protein